MMDIERLYKNFEVLEDWEDRYRFIIELGKKLPVLPEEQKTEENRVHGCMSTVHMVIRKSDENPPRVHFEAYSDALIVNGLIAVLKIIYDDKTLEEIEKINIEDVFKKLGLENHLSPNRRNGFFSMVERLRTLSKSSTN